MCHVSSEWHIRVIERLKVDMMLELPVLWVSPHSPYMAERGKN